MNIHPITGFKYSSQCRTFINGNDTIKNSIGGDIWNEARRELGLHSIDKSSNIMYYFKHAHTEQTKCSNSPLEYKDIWKCGNDFFQFNLRDNCHSVVSHGMQPHDSFVFSFVRNPFDRFESAYREVAYRIHVNLCKNKN